jgi:hypothetical protein
VALNTDNENAFLCAAAERERLDALVRKMLIGKLTVIDALCGPLAMRCLMLADPAAEESVRLQQHGQGPCRYVGCGLFIPCKGIRAVKRDAMVQACAG